MRFYWIHTGLLFLFVGSSSAQMNRISDSVWFRSLRSAPFASVDISVLQDRARQRLEGPDKELDLMLRKNLTFIFYNKLNRKRFLVAPPPEKVVERIRSVLDLSEDLSTLISEGRSLMLDPQQDSPPDFLVKRIGQTARDLRDAFEGYFLEGHGSDYSLKVPLSREPGTQFMHFLVQSHRISLELTRKLDEYFFDTSPGAVTLSQYRASSIRTLTESLQLLSRAVEKRISR